MSELEFPLFTIGIRASIWPELSVRCSEVTALPLSAHMADNALIEADPVEVNKSVYILQVRRRCGFGSQNNMVPLSEIYNV